MQSVMADAAVSIGHQPVHSCAGTGQKSLDCPGSKSAPGEVYGTLADFPCSAS